MHGVVLHYFMLHIKRDYLYMKTDRIFLLLIKSERFFATVHCADTDEHSYKPRPTRGSVLHASGCLARWDLEILRQEHSK
jgi:hypothetical protein